MYPHKDNLRMSINLLNKIAELTKNLELYKLAFDSIVSGAIISDNSGRILYLNKPYCEFLGLDNNNAEYVGKHCSDVIENTRLHIVAKTGIPEMNRTQVVNGQNMIVHRVPIKKDGEVIAVFGIVIFQNLQEINKLVERTSILESKVKLYEEELQLYRSTSYTLDSIIGISQAINQLKKEALKATSNGFPVLITGESGTGKELFAQAVHHGSSRRVYPFVRINCAAIPKDLLESELFGYEKGAFTGADSRGKPGKFELANRGTIFLDEVGDLPLEMQPKILRVLEEKEFERVGGSKVIKSDFRLIAATNRNMEEMMNQNLFRSDPFYRMNVISLSIPPLRDRKEDIWSLANHILKEQAKEIYPFDVSIDEEIRQVFNNYNWPGNVRELRNVIERALSSLDGSAIRLRHLPLNLTHQLVDKPGRTTMLSEVIARAEKEAIIDTLKNTKNNKTQTAKLLGIHRTLLYKKMSRYGIPCNS